MATPEKRAAMQKKFKQLDTDGNGALDFNELHDLLLKGHPGFKEEDAWDLFRKCDTDGSGTVSFDEFLNYIYGESTSHAAGRSTEGRHAALAAKSGPKQDGTEEDWGKCFGVFEAYAGKDMDGKEFAKFCKDNHLVGHGMKKTDIDLIFAKVVPKGKRRMDFEMFKESVRHIASKRSCSNRDVQVIVESSGGPVMSGTKAEYSKFYDDKSTYTGAATANDNLGADHGHAFGRHEKQQAAAAAKGDAADDEDASLWPQINEIFNQFVTQDCAGDGLLDGRTFLKLLNDSHTVSKSFTKQDVDIVFSTVARKAKKIDFDMFQHAVRNIAAKKKCGTADVQQTIISAGGPQMHGVTKLEAVKFYDDKDQYTGAAAGVFDRGGHGEDRHARLAAEEAEKGGADEGEHPWEACIATFNAYGGENGVDSREFNKMCNDCGLYDKKFTKNDVDIVFTKAKGSQGVRSLNADTFQTAVRLIANKKGCPTYQVQNTIANSEGPIIKGTEGASRFHDDKDSYTGSHVGK